MGDVASSLPRALKKSGVDIRIVLPFYQALQLKGCKKHFIKQFTLMYADKLEKVQVYGVTHPLSKVPVYLLQNSTYLDAPLFPDTYAFFDKAIVAIVGDNLVSWVPDLMHCNDLHTAFIPLLLKEKKSPIKTMLTLHNLSYQGRTSIDILRKTGIDPDKCQIVQWEIGSRQINFLLEGITHADIITTVSPTYAKEILTEQFGEGLEGVLRAKEGRIFGVLNGIDDYRKEDEYKPRVKKTTILPPKHFVEDEKKLNKKMLQKKLGLKIDESVPLIAFIGRFDPLQKGIDILHKMLRTIDLSGYEFIVLGKGNVEWEERFLWLDTFYPKNISCTFVFNNVLANQIYAGSDFIIVPSKFEPCGLIQMIAMSYGTLPIVHSTGGLIDSVTNEYNGFLFNNYSMEALQNTVEKAVTMWRNEKEKYKKMVENALATNFSWDKSAAEYINLYKRTISGN